MQATGTVPCLVLAVPADSPQDHARTSMSPLCTLSVDSPWLPSIFRNMSVAAMALLDANRPVAITPVVNDPLRLRRFIVSSFRDDCRVSAAARAQLAPVWNGLSGEIRTGMSGGFETG